MRRAYVRRSEHGMKRNAEIGFFTKPSGFRYDEERWHNNPQDKMVRLALRTCGFCKIGRPGRVLPNISVALVQKT